jgi:transcriptional regulator with XRE-family HTH domain
MVNETRNYITERLGTGLGEATMGFGSYIRRKREEAGIPLRDFAQRINISPAYWSRIEREMEKPPKDELMENAARVLGLDLDEVFIEASRLPPDMQRDVRGVVHAYRKRPKSED